MDVKVGRGRPLQTIEPGDGAQGEGDRGKSYRLPKDGRPDSRWGDQISAPSTGLGKEWRPAPGIGIWVLLDPWITYGSKQIIRSGARKEKRVPWLKPKAERGDSSPSIMWSTCYEKKWAYKVGMVPSPALIYSEGCEVDRTSNQMQIFSSTQADVGVGRNCPQVKPRVVSPLFSSFLYGCSRWECR